MAQSEGHTKTITFNVGGRLFQTSSSLLDRHEETMLARLVSDTWSEDDDKPVFIDRDGDIFAQVLNYLRYGSIVLPPNVPKEMFLRDMDFYGIVPEEGTVKTPSEGWAARVVGRYKDINNLEAKRQELEAERQNLERDKDALKLENDIDFLANHCASKFLQYANNQSSEDVNVYVNLHANGNDEEGKKLSNAASHLCGRGRGTGIYGALVPPVVRVSPEHKEMFEKSLSSKFGLRVKEIYWKHESCVVKLTTE